MDFKNGTEVGTKVSGNTKRLPRNRNFCFTSFKIEEPKFLENMRYLAYGKEICPETKKEHWQGFVSYKNARDFSAVIKEFKGDHVEIIKGTIKDNIKYCSKEGKFTEHGELPISGKRNDLTEVAEAIINKTFDKKDYPTQYIKFHKGITLMQDELEQEEIYEIRKSKFENYYNNLPSNILINIMNMEAHIHNNKGYRIINWIWSEKGETGKSTFGRKLLFNNKAMIFTTTDINTVAHALSKKPSTEIIIFDLSRDKEGYISYGVFESLIEGVITTKKYDSKTIYLLCEKVIILANFEPDLNTMSIDRWNILKIE